MAMEIDDYFDVEEYEEMDLEEEVEPMVLCAPSPFADDRENIEDERHTLRNKSESLESKNKELKVLLNQREKEIASLLHICTFQEEKKKDSLALLRKNQDLQRALDESRTKYCSLEEKNKEMQVKIRQNDLVLKTLKDQKQNIEKKNMELTESLKSNKLKVTHVFFAC